MLSMIIAAFFFIKMHQSNNLVGEFIADALINTSELNKQEKVLLISHKIYNETNNFINRDELDWYSEWEASSFFNMTSAVGIEYNCYGITGEPGDGPCGTMTKIFLLTLWDMDIPARKLQLHAINNRGGHTMAEFFYKGKWRVISPSDSSFVWRNDDSSIATVEDILNDSTLFVQIFKHDDDWPYAFKKTSNINWEKIPAFLASIINFIIGDEAYENTETPALYEQPRKLLFIVFSCLTMCFLIFYYFVSRKLKTLKG